MYVVGGPGGHAIEHQRRQPLSNTSAEHTEAANISACASELFDVICWNLHGFPKVIDLLFKTQKRILKNTFFFQKHTAAENLF
jgi:hypothetical protein